MIGCLFPFLGLTIGGTLVAAGIALGEPAIVAGGAAGGLVFVVVGAVVFRTGKPKLAKHLSLTVDNPRLARGEKVTGRLEITDPGKARETIELGLECAVFYDHESRDSEGGTSRSTVRVIGHQEWRSVSPSQTLHPFEFEVPLSAPYSHEGSALSFRWRVSAREPVTLRSDPRRDVDLWVTP